jgi:hypothetical protein
MPLDIIASFSDPRAMVYAGGKNGAGVYQTIINLMPPHDVYIEPFLGGGAIMRQKRPAVRFRWAQNDLVSLDNMLTAHARDPYCGARKIVVAMGDMVNSRSLSGGHWERQSTLQLDGI